MQENEPRTEMAAIVRKLSNSDSAASPTPDSGTNTRNLNIHPLHSPRKPEVKSNVFTDSRNDEAEDVGSASG